MSGTKSMRPCEPPMPDPLAFFLTWTTYGSWLPGDERGWILKGQGVQLPDPVRKKQAESLLTEPPCTLDREERDVVEATIERHCEIRGWKLHAVNCRTSPKRKRGIRFTHWQQRLASQWPLSPRELVD